MTAAHCINPVNNMRDTSIYIGQGNNSRRVNNVYPVSEGFRYKKYNKEDNWFGDVGYFVLENPLPIDPDKIIPVLHKKSEIEEILQVGNLSTIIGFGKREDNKAGVKYIAETNIVKLLDFEVQMGGSGIDSCRYDSGGPAYARLANGEWRVFGVVSRGIRAGCGEGGIWGLMHEHMCWIQERVEFDLGLEKGYCP
jgi:secreted trypsin-like serine protease